MQLHPWWKIEGASPADPLAQKKLPGYDLLPGSPKPVSVLLGAKLAKEIKRGIGDYVGYDPPPGVTNTAHAAFRVVGILKTGDSTEEKLIVPLGTFVNQQGDISRVDISARTKPEDAFARRDPDTMSGSTREIWYCRPYANSIAYQIREAIPGAQAEQVRRVEQTEGTVLERISGLMWLVSGAALLAAGFAVSAAMATAVLERRREIGLMRSLGASKAAIATLFYAESGLLAIVAGSIGYLAGSLLAFWLGARIFPGDGAAPLLNFVLLPVVVAMALIVAMAGATPSIRKALNMDPSAVLRVDA
jgi:putative ABC transport system permease protein